jgi:iron complex outermembrane receptor protein
LGWRKNLNKHHAFLLFAPVNLTWMNVPAQGMKSQLKAGLSAAHAVNYFNERLQVSLQASGQFINDDLVFLPGANASFAITDWLGVRGNVQRTYRAPTLNEWYFTPGGNPSLKPEQGWSGDMGYTVKTGMDKPLSLSHDVSVFDRSIKDWIIWFGGAIWTPHNIARVHSRGVETENMLRWSIGTFKFHLGLNTAYVLATTVESDMLNDDSIGRQIPYSPRYNGQVNAGFTYRSLYFNYNHTYTGYRFTTTDESNWLNPYNTGNIQLAYNTTFQHDYTVDITAQCNNIWNQRYAVVAQRPMPGTNWLLGLKISKKK